jgi:pyruvate/oxaloacetate carboxyltransferase
LRREEVEQTRARNDLLHGKCAFTVEGYVQMAEELMDLDSDFLCIKDMATLLETPAGV